MDERLWADAMAGDEAAFTALFDRYEQQVFVYFRRRRIGEELSEELAQQAFVALIESGHRFDAAKGPFRAFLFGIVRNTWLKHLERSRTLPDLASELGRTEQPPEQSIEGREASEALNKAMNGLPPGTREVLALRVSNQLSIADIAECMSMPVGTVKSHLHRARQQLRALLSNDTKRNERGGL